MKTIIDFLVSIKDDKEKLAKIWCELNGWKFPSDIPLKLKPDWWDYKDTNLLTHRDISNRISGFNSVAMEFCFLYATEKEIKKYWKLMNEPIK